MSDLFISHSSHDDNFRLSFDITEYLLAGNSVTAVSLLRQVATDPDLPSNARTFIDALQAIVAGNRDRVLADTPDLSYGMAAEILFLIEKLENHERGK